MTRAVIFDIGNVLLRWEPAALWAALLPDAAATDAFMTEVGFEAWNLEQDRGRSWDDGVAQLSAAFPAHADAIRGFHQRWHEALPGPIEGSVAILESLHAAGVPLYAITNYSSEKWAESLARFPFLTSRFRDVVVSAHEGTLKPDRRIFEICLARNGLIAGECVFIDDSAKNVAGAAALGFDAIRFTDAETLARDLRERGLPV